MTAGPPSSGSTPEGFRIPTTWIVLGYAAIFFAFASIANVRWADVNPILKAGFFHSRALRYVLMHEDTASARLRTDATREAVLLKGSGFRAPGVVLAVEAPTLSVEHPCLPSVPHSHPAEIQEDELVLAFEAKSGIPGTAILPAVAETDLRFGAAMRYGPKLPLGGAWREFRSRLDEMGPQMPASPGGRYLTAVLVHVHPPTAIDLAIRDVRLLRVPKRPNEPRAELP